MASDQFSYLFIYCIFWSQALLSASAMVTNIYKKKQSAHPFLCSIDLSYYALVRHYICTVFNINNITK